MSKQSYKTGTILPSAARTTTQTSDIINVDGCSGINLFINITNAGTGSITATIEGKDVTSGTFYTILSSGNLATNQFKRLTVFPGAPVSANASANDLLPKEIRVVITHNNANTITYSVGIAT
jgi:hypothetical protein